jgi:hypothetical protein
MFVLTRRSALPRLQFVPGGLARWHDGRVTLLPLTTAPGHPVELSVETGAAGGCGVVLKIPDRPDEVVAHYPSRRSARRQLRRLAGDAGWSAAGGWGRGLLLAVLLFVAWFLFFVPGDPAALAVLEGSGAGAGDGSPPTAPVAPAVPSLAHPPAAHPPATHPPAAAPDDGPAFVDDPADPATAPAAPDAAPAAAR